MLHIFALIFGLEATPSPAPSPSPSGTPAAAAPLPTPLPTDNAAVSKMAREQFYAFAAGKIDGSQYSIEIPKDVMPQTQAFLSALGDVKSVTLVQSTKMGDSDVYVYKFTCANGAALEQLSVKNAKINGIFFRPVQ
jgi:predicted Abi (CAAX) family protease